MTAEFISGDVVAKKIQARVREEIQRANLTPRLDVILIGEHKPSEVYVRAKAKTCGNVGIECVVHKFAESCAQWEVIKLLTRLNDDPSVHGILVQLPLPVHVDKFIVSNHISSDKDVDCFHPFNLGQLFYNRVAYTPCTAGAVMAILDHYDISVVGQHVAIINDSALLGRPLSALLTNRGATVTVCNKQTINLTQVTKSADVIVVGVGRRPDFVLDEKFCGAGVKIIDCGINKLDGKVIGDVDVDAVKNRASMISVVPGGVGPVTIAILMENIVRAANEATDDLRPEYNLAELRPAPEQKAKLLSRILAQHEAAIMASAGVTGCSVGPTDTGDIRIKVRGTAFDVDYIRSLVGRGVVFEKESD